MNKTGQEQRMAKRFGIFRRIWKDTIKPWWISYQWFVIFGGAIAVLGFGYCGFKEYYESQNTSLNTPSIFFSVIQLFVLEFSADASMMNWKLEIARWLAPMVSGITAASALAVIFREQIRLFKIQFLRNHIIICGLGRKGLLLSQTFGDAGYKVVVIEKDEQNDMIEQCRENGSFVLLGSALNPIILNKARLKNATHMFAVCSDDGMNAAIAAQACEQLPEKRKNPLNCVIHIVDPQLCRLLKEREFETDKSEKNEFFRLEFFNLSDLASKALIEKHPPFKKLKEFQSPPPHLLIVGAEGMGESLIVHTARKWRKLLEEGKTGSNRKFKITLIDNDAKSKNELFHFRYPHLKELCDINSLEIDIKSKEFEEGHFLFSDENRELCDLIIIYVCINNDSDALKAGLNLHQGLRKFDISIIIQMDREVGLANLLHGDSHGFRNLNDFGILDRVLKPELLLNGTYETLAHAIHKEYCQTQRKKGKTTTTNSSIVPWDELPEHLQESNRRQADYMGVKLKAVGCYIAPLTDWNNYLIEFSPDEIEKMAEMEHEHWMEERKKNGWEYDPQRNDKKKIHPSMVEWDKLSEDEKDKDRNPVKKVSIFLAEAGFQIYRREKKS